MAAGAPHHSLCPKSESGLLQRGRQHRLASLRRALPRSLHRSKCVGMRRSATAWLEVSSIKARVAFVRPRSADINSVRRKAACSPCSFSVDQPIRSHVERIMKFDLLSIRRKGRRPCSPLQFLGRSTNKKPTSNVIIMKFDLLSIRRKVPRRPCSPLQFLGRSTNKKPTSNVIIMI